MESISAANAAVKYSVVKKSNVDGFLRAMAVNKTVQRGKRVVAALAVFVYTSKIFDPRDFSPSAAASLICKADELAMDKGAIDLRLSDAKAGRELMTFPTL